VPIGIAADQECQVNGPQVYGSGALHQLLVNARVCSDLTIKPNGAHGIYLDNPGSLFRVSKASCFFKSVFCKNCITVQRNDSVAVKCRGTALRSITQPELITGMNIVNPVRDQLKVNGLLSTPNTRLYVYDAAGRLRASNTGNSSIAVNMLSPGWYLLKVQEDKAVKLYRFVKE
jgi:hypothetical protein